MSTKRGTSRFSTLKNWADADPDPCPYMRIRIPVFLKTFGSGKQIKCWRPACLAAHSQQIDDVVMLTDHLKYSN
jgi:hypothetical protein